MSNEKESLPNNLNKPIATRIGSSPLSEMNIVSSNQVELSIANRKIKNLEEKNKELQSNIDSLNKESTLNTSLFNKKQDELKQVVISQKNLLEQRGKAIEELGIKNEELETDLTMEKLKSTSVRSQLDKVLNEKKRNIRVTLYRIQASTLAVISTLIIIYAFWTFILINPDIFKVTNETISFITNFYNIIILFLIPLFFGSLSAIARISLSGISIRQSFRLIFASGVMAAFSWVGIKSKLFIALLTPYLEAKPNVSEAIKDIDITEFYSMVLVAILVGMFASNLFVFIDNKTKMLKLESKINAEDEIKISKETSKKED